MRIFYRIEIAFLLVTILFAPYAFATDLRSDNDAVVVADNAMKKIAVDDIEGAIETLRPYAGIEFGELNVLTKSLSVIYKSRPGGFGDPLGYKYIAQESLGDTVLRVTFIQKFKHKPLLWNFYFYKPERDWLFWTVSFKGAAQVMFDPVDSTLTKQLTLKMTTQSKQ